MLYYSYMKDIIPIQPILLVIALAIVSVVILVGNQFNLFQSGSLENSQDIMEILQERFPDSTIHQDITDPMTIVLVHNGESEQCQRAMRFIDNVVDNTQYTSKVYVIHGQDYLQSLENLSEDSCWVDHELTEQWLIYPTIFFRNTVYVGFGPATRHDIQKQMKNLKKE